MPILFRRLHLSGLCGPGNLVHERIRAVNRTKVTLVGLGTRCFNPKLLIAADRHPFTPSLTLYGLET